MMPETQMVNDERRVEVAGSRGFTLTELLVAMVIAGILSAAILALFSTTSNALGQADSLASVVDRARFSLERLRTEVQAAGAFATPDSQNDPRVQPKPSTINRNYQVAGLVSYPGWQDNVPSGIPDANCRASDGSQGTCGSADLQPSFDGFIVMGAIDFPVTFEVREVSESGGSAVSVANRKGLLKLAYPDPFTRDELVPVTSGNAMDEFSSVANAAPSSLLRVVAPNSGNVQFAPVEDVADTTGANGEIGLAFNFEAGLGLYRGLGPTGAEGLPKDSQQEEDQRYPGAAMIDAYRYYVDRDPENPDSYQLLRQRLDAAELAKSMGDGLGSGSASWSGLSKSGLEGIAVGDPVVIANRVVDFQFWVDCADTSGAAREISWGEAWDVPSGGTGDTGHACLAPSDPKPGLARMAHIRMSMRTERERPDLRQQPFAETGGGQRTLRTYDVDPNVEGKAQVTTVQADVELTNFAIRGITAGATTNN